MRLIGPDREEAASEQGGSSHQDSPLSRLPRKTLSELSLMKSRSRENIAGSGLGGGELAGGEENLSFHMARPATVISGSSLASSANSPSTAAATSVGGGGGGREDEVQLLLQQRGASPHVSSVSIGVVINSNSSSGAARSGRNSSSSGGQASPVVVLATSATSHARANNKETGGGGNSNSTTVTPDKDMDWNSLVDTATKAILSGSEEASAEGSGGGAQRRPRSALLEGEEVRRLLERVSSLEVELAGERAGREQLGRQVDQLREENVRLQEESQTAAQQLRRFTEWFFQTIDKS